MSLESISPNNGQKIREFAEDSPEDIQRKLAKAHRAFENWRRYELTERISILAPLESILLQTKQESARLISEEMGKPIKQSIAEVEKCAFLCKNYLEAAPKLLEMRTVKTEASKSFVSFSPLGTILGIMPWNFPFWQVFRFALPALIVGNSAVLKHSSNVSGCSLLIEKLFQKLSGPQDLFQSLIVKSDQIEAIIKDPRIQAVSLTGSSAAGRKVAATAGSVLKKCVLELGGSDPYIILEDAEIESAVKLCVESRLINSGQSCIAAKRFIFPQSLKARIEEAFVETMKTKKMDDPFDSKTDVGPQARDDLRKEVHSQVLKSLSEGADLLLGGQMPDRPGFYYSPTILSSVTPQMTAGREEVFGPVAALMPVKDEKEAFEVANRSQYGLGGAIFSKDLERAERLARDTLEVGSAFINSFVKSDPRLPFGGIKESGYGRELGEFGILEFTNIKTVYIA